MPVSNAISAVNRHTERTLDFGQGLGGIFKLVEPKASNKDCPQYCGRLILVPMNPPVMKDLLCNIIPSLNQVSAGPVPLGGESN